MRPFRSISVTFGILLAGAVLLPTSALSQQEGSEEERGAANVRSAYVVEGVDTKEERTEIVRQGIAIDGTGEEFVEVTANDAEVKKLRSLGYDPRPDDRAGIEPRDFPSEDSGYHDYAEMTAEITKAARDHPKLVQVSSIGESYQGRKLWAAKVSDDPGKDEKEPEVLYVGSHHAREHLTVEMSLYLLKLYTDEYDSSKRVRNVVNGREIWLVFNLNPDGSEYDIRRDAYDFWRKNRQPNAGTNAVGTDLNRNYGYKWGCCGGSSGSPSSDVYRGPKPFSAPETDALRDFVNGRVIGGEQQIQTAISFHTYSELILYPYGYTYENVPPDMDPKDFRVFRKMANTMAETNGYTPGQSSDLYVTDGDMTDWAYGRHGIFAYTFEMYPKSNNPGFYPPDEQIGPQTRRNKQAALYLAEKAGNPYSVLGEGPRTN